MAEVVNLDALIPREDFLAADNIDVGQDGKTEISRTDLMKSESFFSTLRKPDFQRETAAWSPEQICDFIEAFVDRELIPSVICWESPTRLTFVIDGGHRLSAIIAWLQDDYGDRETSTKFYRNEIPEEQKRIAKKTRDLVERRVGAWRDLQAEAANPGSNPKLSLRARSVANSKIPLLWVRGNDSTKAERAFKAINRSSVRIDPTELKILSGRFEPNAIAARAIVRNATGFCYWKNFSDEGRADLERNARDVYKYLYSPPLTTQIRNEDLPIAGHGFGSQTLPLIFDFVNIANGTKVIDATKKSTKDSDAKIADEVETRRCVKRTEQLARRMTGTHAKSLGLHPAVYFYSANARHQPTAVLAMAELLVELERTNGFFEFTRNRAAFEQFLVEHKEFINQMVTKTGSMAKGYRQLKNYFAFVLDLCGQGKTNEEIADALRSHERYQTLVKERPIKSAKAKDISKDAKHVLFLKEALENAFVCKICKARIDKKAMSFDHIEEKQNGGLGTLDNTQIVHPYCNSTYKRFLAGTITTEDAGE